MIWLVFVDWTKFTHWTLVELFGKKNYLNNYVELGKVLDKDNWQKSQNYN